MAAPCVRRCVLSRALRGLRGCAGPGYRSVPVTWSGGPPPACRAPARLDDITGGSSGGGGGGAVGGAPILWAAAAFSLFGSSEENSPKEEMILLLKKAQLSVRRGQPEAASSFLHQALALAHQTQDHQAIIYTYIQMANLAYVRGQLDSAEKLFKAAMSFMLAGGTPEDDNAVIEMSLKLAAIYAEQSRVDLAEQGFRFCTEALEAKLENQQQEEGTEQVLRRETRLLLGLSLDSRARFRTSRSELDQAAQDYRRALDICQQEQGGGHPQTLVLMSDLATVLDLQGRHGDALALLQQAVDRSRAGGHPDQPALLANMAAVLLHTGRVQDSARLYREALVLARRVGDQEAEAAIQEGLQELKRRRGEGGPK